jgi:TonB-dependent starch-binding outer membrane protein SusC
MKNIIKSIFTSIMVLFLICAANTTFAQTKTISGKVSDEQGIPMKGVSIIYGDFSSLTNEDGTFSIVPSKSEKTILSLSFPGYITKELTINPALQTLTVKMEKDVSQNKGKLVSVAYSTENKEDITSSVSTVSGDVLEKSIHPNLQNALAGRLSGLVIYPSDYEPGNSDYSAFIRGLKTTSGNKAPLVLVDHIERDMSQLSPNEIESVTVLKDAAALALYGSRGANGVILIVTKRGKISPRSVTVDALYSLQQTQKLRDYLNAYDYATLYNKAYQLDGNTADFYSPETVAGFKKTVENSSDANPYLYPNNNFVSEFINKISYQKKVDITMTGGNTAARYFAMVGYLNQDGVFKNGDVNEDYNTNTKYQRFNFRSNVDITVSDMVSAFLDMAGRIEMRHYPGRSAWDIFNCITTTPSNAYPILNEDGSLGGTTTYQNNPYGLITQSGYSETMRRIFDANVGFKIDFNKWVNGLTFTARSGFDFNNLKKRGLTKNFKVYEYVPLLDEMNEFGNEDQSMYESTDLSGVYYNQLFGHAQFDYKRVFSDVHHFSAIALFDVSKRTIPGNNPSYKNVAFGTRLNYNYNKKYFVEIVASATANEAFKKGNRFGLFPATSIGWILSEEDFLKNSTAINFLKLRTSYGLTGLDRPYGYNADYRFLYLDEWSTGTGGYSFGNPQAGTSGSSQTAVGNENLKWENASKFNFGLDGEFFNNQIYLTSDIYYEKRTGIWVQRYGWIPSTYGAPLPLENAGSTESKGFELTLGAKNNQGSFKYDVKLMADYCKSKILDMQEAMKLWDYQYLAGKQIGEIWSLETLGLFKDDADVQNSPLQTFGTVRPGDIKYGDYNKDGIVDDNDYHATGKNTFPSWIISFNSDFSYKNFDFSMLWQGMLDRYVITPLYELPFWNSNATTEAFYAWTPETAATAKYPRLTTKNYENNARTSDFWLTKASYLRLKSVEIGYSLPTATLNSVGIKNLRIFLNGYNLLTISPNDFDPEVINAGIYQYPAARVYSIGLNLTF